MRILEIWCSHPGKVTVTVSSVRDNQRLILPPRAFSHSAGSAPSHTLQFNCRNWRSCPDNALDSGKFRGILYFWGVNTPQYLITNKAFSPSLINICKVQTTTTTTTGTNKKTTLTKNDAGCFFSQEALPIWVAKETTASSRHELLCHEILYNCMKSSSSFFGLFWFSYRPWEAG